MSERGYVMLSYDAPDDMEFQAWLHGTHFAEVLEITPGARSITRLEVLDPAPGQRRYIALIQTDDLDATLAYRQSPGGQKVRADADEHGVRKRTVLATRIIHETQRR